ncbi:polyketide synthase [Nemania sp. FL0031]|nr:polyketide synthase [Nemania sp. FL0031]
MDVNRSARLILFSHEFPSGEMQDLMRRLHRYAKIPRYTQLGRFLQECALVLKQEVQKLPRILRDLVPPFHDVITLASHWDELKETPLRGTWEGAFLCIYEIAMLIGHHEAQCIPYRPHGVDAEIESTCLSGISVGLFSAAAGAVSNSLVDLVYYGAESVRIAFAFCVHVGRVSELLENTLPAQGTVETLASSWAHVIIGVPAETVQAELDRFNGQDESGGGSANIGPLTRISISHIDRASVGVTGPPALLVQLFCDSEVLGSSRHSQLPILGGLCHVSNVYDVDDVHAILETACVLEKWGSRPVGLPLISPYTGRPYPAANAYHLIEAICTEALTKPLYFDKIAQGLVTQISPNLPSRVEDLSLSILHYRTTLISNDIISDVMEKLSISNIRRQDLLDWVMRDEAGSDKLYIKPSLPQNSKLAVVGMACRMPGGADTPEKFWELLMEGRDTHTLVPADRFDLEAHFDPSGETENAIGTRFGNFVDNPGLFDAGFFNMSPREAEQTDPMQRLALVTAYEALEMAGFVPGRTPSSHVSRVGTYYGQASDDYREVNAGQKIGTYGIPGTERAFGNGRINYFFNFQGPSFSIDTACSSGLAAVHAACAALWAGEADTVVAGGLNIITSPDIYCMLTKGHFLSKTGQCKVWDAEADGYCRGDGVGSVVIKRLEDALLDNDNILATILSGATNHSAESISITQPHAGAQIANYRQVLDKAGVSPSDVSYVELHGTGTQVGDAVESESVLNFFAPPDRRLRSEQRLHLGAVKSNIGHGEAAAGVASLIKVLLMYHHGTIPRHVGIKTSINPVVAQHLAYRNAGILSENTPWIPMSPNGRRYSVVNSFGAHGGNTTLLLEDAPSPQPRPRIQGDWSSRTTTCQVVCVSAKSKVSLRGNINALLRYLDAHPETDLADLAYTTCARRIHHHIRISRSVASTTQLLDFLRAAADDVDVYAKHISSTKKKPIAFAFSGQGCFSQGAAAQLFERVPGFREQVLQLDRIVRRLGFPSVLVAVAGSTFKANHDGVRASQACSTGSSTDGDIVAGTIVSLDSNSTSSEEAAASESPLVTQLALVVLQIALARYWESLGIKPSVVIGHSLGEYPALVVAGVLSVVDALYLVGKRAELMLAACKPGSHAMLSVRGASATQIAELCRGHEKKYHYEVSCLNGRTDIVISGKRTDMVALRDMLQGPESGFQGVLLDIPFAFHSAQLDPILGNFEQVARRVTFKAPKIPFISPLLKQYISRDGLIDGAYLRRATREPVDFVAALDAAVSEGVVDDNVTWIDIGPHPVSISFIRNHYGVTSTQTLASMRRGDDTLATLTGSLAALHCQGYGVAWNEYFSPYETCYRLLRLDSYQWNNKNYWIPYEGTWALDKAHAGRGIGPAMSPPTATFFTSSVQQVLSEDFGESVGRMTALSNLTHPDLVGSASGHRINGRSVVTGSTWADLMLTAGDYLYKRMLPDAATPYMNVRNMEVLEAQVLPEEESPSSQLPAQYIYIDGVLDISQEQAQISLYTAGPGGAREPGKKAFATATVCYEDAQTWQAEWRIASHLVTERAQALWKAAAEDGNLSDSTGVSKLSRNAVYQLFANVVDYGPRYRGMHRVALAEGSQEATADVVLDADRHGTWHTPPHWIDSAFQLAGFVMNALGVVNGAEPGETESSRDFFYITPGWQHLRLVEPLQAGPDIVYRNYVRMFPVSGETGVWAGDIYLLHADKIVGVCAGIRFKRVLRAAMPVMFPRRQEPIRKGHKQGGTRPQSLSNVAVASKSSASKVAVVPPAPALTPGIVQKDFARDNDSQNPRVAACLELIADETGLDLEDLVDRAAFADLGVDSLMSLALAGKIRAKTGIDIQASTFLECDTVHDFVTWLSK